MQLPPPLLDHWLAAYEFASPPIRHNLGTSTGPLWSFGDIVALGGKKAQDALDALPIAYAPANGSVALRQCIADLHSVGSDRIDPDWVVVTTGASEALSALFCLVAEPGASIVLPSPAFPSMAALARAWGLNVVTYDVSRENQFIQSADSVLAAVDQTARLVIVNAPHNPTGSVMGSQEMSILSEALAARGVPLVVDEVYHPLYFDAAAPPPTAARLPNSIVVGDMSKAFSLPGLRVGWLIDRNSTRRQRLIDARSYFTICGSPVTEALALMALSAQSEILSRLESISRANLSALDAFMHVRRDVMAWVRPVGGTTAFPWLRDGRNARPFCAALAREGVLFVPGDCFGTPEHFRIGFGAQSAGFEEALEIVSGVMTSVQTG